MPKSEPVFLQPLNRLPSHKWKKEFHWGLLTLCWGNWIARRKPPTSDKLAFPLVTCIKIENWASGHVKERAVVASIVTQSVPLLAEYRLQKMSSSCNLFLTGYIQYIGLYYTRLLLNQAAGINHVILITFICIFNY